MNRSCFVAFTMYVVRNQNSRFVRNFFLFITVKKIGNRLRLDRVNAKYHSAIFCYEMYRVAPKSKPLSNYKKCIKSYYICQWDRISSSN